MNKILGFLKDYFASVDKRSFFLSTLFIGLFIFINYHFKLEKTIVRLPFLPKFTAWFFIFFISFSFPYLLSFLRKRIVTSSKFYTLLFIAPALFAWKISSNIHFNFS